VADGAIDPPAKAAALERLAAAGLAVPDWRLVPADALTELIPADMRATVPTPSVGSAEIALVDEWRQRIAGGALSAAADEALGRARQALGPGQLMVRSASALEDGVRDAAAGLFDSVGPVAHGAHDIAGAALAVLASMATPAVWAYLASRGLSFADVRMALIVQRYAQGIRATGYTRAPGARDAALLELDDGRWARVDRATGAVLASAGEGPWEALAELGTACEQALGGETVDFEAIVAPVGGPGTQPPLWAVQARPVPAELAPPPGPADAALAFSRATPDVEWTWDAAHNPEPLSPVQADLVRRVDAAGLGPWSLRVVEGYLYSAPRHPVSTAPVGGARLAYEKALPAVAEAEAEAEANPGLPAALRAYESIYAVWANTVAPAVSESRLELPRWLARVAPTIDARSIVGDLVSGPSDARLETLAARVAAGERTRDEFCEAVGTMAAAWDVCCPTLAEQPAALAGLIEGARLPETARRDEARRVLYDAVPRWRHNELNEQMGRAQEAADVAELDDRLFARAQWLVRRSLLRAAALLAIAPDDIFLLPLADVLDSEARGSVDRARVDELIDSARARLDRQRALAMPLSIRDGVGRAASPAGGTGRRWRARGSGGRALGRAALVEPGDRGPVPAGAIAVCPALTPGMLALVRHAAAFVCERGGLLDHGAAMARALGVPVVVGCTDAGRQLRDGDLLWVDGDAGVVSAL